MFHSLTPHQQQIIAHFAWKFLQFGSTKLNVWVMSNNEYIDSAELDKLVDLGFAVRIPGHAGNYGHDTYSATVAGIELGLSALVLDGEASEVIAIGKRETDKPEQSAKPKRYPKQVIKLALTPEAVISPEIKAEMVGRFAVHVDEARTELAYTISHVPSGKTMMPMENYRFTGRNGRRIALECAETLEANIDPKTFYQKEDGEWEANQCQAVTVLNIICGHCARC